MPSYAIDSAHQLMTATGIVEAVNEWEETADGRRRPSDKQARNADTGMPLWAVEVLYVQTAFGRQSTVTAKVAVDSVDEPKPTPLAGITFRGLRVEVRVNKTGGLVEMWSAEGVGDASKPAPRPAAEKAA